MITLLALVIAVGLAALGRRAWTVHSSTTRRALATTALSGAALSLAAATFSLWYHHRPQPREMTAELFQGVTYHRQPLESPRPMVVHWVEIDVTTPGFGLLITPPEPAGGRSLQARTVSAFLQRHGVQVAVNGGFFEPWFARGPLWYYPHTGDPVDPVGLVISSSRRYGRAKGLRPALQSARDGRVAIGRLDGSGPTAGIDMALQGTRMILDDGELSRDLTLCRSFCTSLHPRTAAAVDRDGRRLILVVVDGRQPGYSEGIALDELARMIRRRGGYRALNLDGGGSSVLVAQGPDGRSRVLSSPIHGRVPPGRERPIATHVGVFAAPSTSGGATLGGP